MSLAAASPRPSVLSHPHAVSTALVDAKYRHAWRIGLISLIGVVLSLFGGLMHGYHWGMHTPILLGAILNSVALFLMRRDYQEVPIRLIHIAYVLMLIALSLQVKSITTLAYYFPVIVLILFGERSRPWKIALMSALAISAIVMMIRFYPAVGLDRATGILYAVSLVDLFISTLFCGILLQKHIHFIKLTRESSYDVSLRQEREVVRKAELLEKSRSQRKAIADLTDQAHAALDRIAFKQARLKASQEQLQQFAYAASHDLKEPVRTIKSFLQVIKRKLYDGGEAADPALRTRMSEHFSYIDSSADAMHRVLEALLEFSRLAGEVPNAQPVDAERLWYKMRVAQGDASAALWLQTRNTAEQPIHWVMADERLLTRVYRELHENAVKFSGAEAPQISLDINHDVSGTVTMSVSDNGIGIDAAYHQQVFGLFKRLHARGEYQGAGLGLAIVRRIVDLQQGEVWLTSTPGSGTQVHIRLPKAEASAA